jgi:phenylalanyl-tRNA synthetase alpha chain
MDALFMPQDHPARQIHDVFQIKEPTHGQIPDPQLFQRVFDAHHHGGKTGSKGWGYSLDSKASSRLLARSHDTGISARELAKNQNLPDRVFFITKAFRPDEIDWKHFIEFDQLGGYVADENISLRDLLGTLKTFAQEVFGAKNVKFAPGYFPFTEPSVEMYAQIPGKGWTEMGGAGLFRPEMLEALSVKCQVGAWGLGIGRLAMLTIGANDIRQLNSHDLQFLREH